MSRLLGPLSETISRVSERASALAADQIAGAGTIAPAATPVTDLRKSRRFIRTLQHTRGPGWSRCRKVRARSEDPSDLAISDGFTKSYPTANGVCLRAQIAYKGRRLP